MSYHPDIELLIGYASGQLSAPLSMAIALHVKACAQCEENIAELESIGGQTLESISANQQLKLKFSDLMRSINALPASEKTDAAENDEIANIAVASADHALFSQLAKRDLKNMPWKKITRKIKQAELAVNDAHYQMALLDISANTSIPKHTHQGNEFTLILQGDFNDKKGCYKAGDFIAQNESHEHQPVAGKNGCVCLVVIDAPLKYTGTFGPVLNWLSRR